MGFENETAAVVDGWYMVVWSDEIEDAPCQTFHFRLIQCTFEMADTLQQSVLFHDVPKMKAKFDIGSRLHKYGSHL